MTCYIHTLITLLTTSASALDAVDIIGSILFFVAFILFYVIPILLWELLKLAVRFLISLLPAVLGNLLYDSLKHCYFSYIKPLAKRLFPPDKTE